MLQATTTTLITRRGWGGGKDREYLESHRGKVMDVRAAAEGKPPRARYVRFASNGNTSNEMNQYIEAEVYGR